MFNLPTLSSPSYPFLPRTLWSPPEQKAQPPSLGDGPSPDNKMTPTSRSSSAIVNASKSSNTVFGRKAFLTSGRLKAILATPSDFLKEGVARIAFNRPEEIGRAHI